MSSTEEQKINRQRSVPFPPRPSRLLRFPTIVHTTSGNARAAAGTAHPASTRDCIQLCGCRSCGRMDAPWNVHADELIGDAHGTRGTALPPVDPRNPIRTRKKSGTKRARPRPPR